MSFSFAFGSINTGNNTSFILNTNCLADQEEVIFLAALLVLAEHHKQTQVFLGCLKGMGASVMHLNNYLLSKELLQLSVRSHPTAAGYQNTSACSSAEVIETDVLCFVLDFEIVRIYYNHLSSNVMNHENRNWNHTHAYFLIAALQITFY